MTVTRRLGIIMPELSDPLDYELLHGVFDTAKALLYDVFLYTGIYNSHMDLQQDSYIRGLENIYTLPAMQQLDGILFAAERFHNRPVLDEIRRQLTAAQIPCLVLGEALLPFENMQPRQQESMHRLTRHLIDAHGCKKIWCITGFRGHQGSEERLAGYRQAMTEAHLPIPENSIFYGEFWRIIPAEIGRKIADGTLEKPEAIVCASDCMASALIETLIQNGIDVPGEIRVTGYDGSWDAWLNVPRITTVEGRDWQYGADAVLALHEMISGTCGGFSSFKQTVRYGESCGCNPAAMPQNPHSPIDGYFRARVKNQSQKRTFLASDLFAQTGGASTLDNWVAKTDRVGHVLQNWIWLDICLCSDWCMNFAHPDAFRQTGFSDQMLLALSKRRGKNAPDQYKFLTRDILPALSDPHEPLLILLTSLHAHGQIFGYLASAYCAAEDIEPDEYYTSWCDAAAHGLYQLQQAMYTEYRRAQMAVLSTHDPETGLYNRRGLAEHLHDLLRQCPHPLLVLMRVSSQYAADVDPALLFANAMRDTLPENALCARMQQYIFAVMLPLPEDADIGEAAEAVRFQIEHRMLHLLGASAQQPPMIQIIRQHLQCSSLADAASAIEKAEQILADSSAADSGFYPDYKEQLLRLRSEILANPQRDWNITNIEKEIGISRSHLQRLYKQQFAASCMDDVIMARIRKAQQLLQFTNLRIQEIALQCGYNNESHFMRQFKEKCGMTALQYRQSKN